MVFAKNYGRMGNVLFQNACAIAYSKRHGIEFTVQTTTNDPFWNPLYLQDLVNPKYNPYLDIVQIDQNLQEGFKEIPFEENWRSKNIVLNGYWQSIKYFEDYFDEVINTFAYPWKLKRDVVSIHIRRGDYLQYPDKHPPVPIEWIEKAMKEFPGKLFMFFSDDIQYCIEHFGYRDNCTFSIGKNEEQDLVEMSCCEHHICSSSTFSLWAYFLNRNPNKKAIFPKLWFMPGWDNWVVENILPPEVIKL